MPDQLRPMDCTRTARARDPKAICTIGLSTAPPEALPPGLPGSVADDSVSHPGHIWNFNPVAGDAHPVAYGVPYSHSGRKESRPPRGHHAPSSANLGAFGQQGIPIAGAGMHLPLSPQSLMQRQLSAGSAMSEPADGVTGYAISTGPRSISGTGSLPGPVGLPSAPPGVHVPLDAVPRYVSGLPGLVPVRAPSFSRASGLPMERGWSNPSLSDGSPTAQLPFDLDEAVFCLSPTAPPGGRRLSEESDLSIARSHPFYQAPPREDGLYHCPFEGDGCKHKAETLKCNYHKHIDSHLRPYRCKMANCSKLQFSSTACLLRHEREAHGLHGHGDKPFTCPFDDCDRSEPGNGFPRKWNLADHMKRVHNYTGTGQTAAAGHKATSVAAASDGILDGLPANSKKGAVVKKTKPRRNSKTAPAVGPRNMSRMAYAPPTGSLPDHVQLFGPDHSSVHGYVDRGAHLMQTSRSLDPLALEPVPSFPDPYGTFDPEAFRLPSGLPMDLAPTGYEMSGAGAGAGASPQWAMLMDHSCVYLIASCLLRSTATAGLA
ncbi:MAG: hypothetical protein M1826_006661 [Phylliscum demangeonii]|nr:MAG: hypothetical protein M1826_006661 [Phylliscum demangeonii]